MGGADFLGLDDFGFLVVSACAMRLSHRIMKKYVYCLVTGLAEFSSWIYF